MKFAELGMSMKTLYKFFPTKLGLIEALIQQNFELLNMRYDSILASSPSAIEKLAGVSRVIVEQQKWLATRPMMESVRDHPPHIWRRIDRFRRERKRKNT